MTHQDRTHAKGSPRQPPQATHLEIDMDSALTPREIQARVRAGESLEDVAQAAGMPTDWVEPFAAPVLAEREFVAGQARACPVRRGTETIAHRTLGEVVTDRLASRRVDLESLAWDAWKLEGRRWVIEVRYESGTAARRALFTYEAGSRFSVADNEDARWLLGLHSASHGPQPGRRRRGEEAEPTVDLNDDLALVRVVQPRVDEPEDPEITAPIDELVQESAEELTEEVEDAYAEAELAEVDGIYDIVPTNESGLDVLYDMLSSFDEDSVQIYTGLIHPPEAPTPAPVLDEVAPPAPEPTPVADPPNPPAVAPDSSTERRDPGRRSKPTKAQPATPPKLRAVPDPEPEITEPEQPSLVEAVEGEPDATTQGADQTPAEAAAPHPGRSKRKRAAVPTWDEIMFGAPKNPPRR